MIVVDKDGVCPQQVNKAQSAHLRLKTLRHPNILKYIDGIEVKTVCSLNNAINDSCYIPFTTSMENRPLMWSN